MANNGGGSSWRGNALPCRAAGWHATSGLGHSGCSASCKRFRTPAATGSGATSTTDGDRTSALTAVAATMLRTKSDREDAATCRSASSMYTVTSLYRRYGFVRRNKVRSAMSDHQPFPADCKPDASRCTILGNQSLDTASMDAVSCRCCKAWNSGNRWRLRSVRSGRVSRSRRHRSHTWPRTSNTDALFMMVPYTNAVMA